MVAINMNPMPSNLLGRKLVYKLEVLLGYQKILDPKGAQTFEGRKN
jgi:hypothetical protein